MKAYINEIGSPVGPVAFATDEEGVLLGLTFREGRRPRSLEKDLKREGFALSRDEDPTAAAREQLVEYFAGERRSFDLPVTRGERSSRKPCGRSSRAFRSARRAPTARWPRRSDGRARPWR